MRMRRIVALVLPILVLIAIVVFKGRGTTAASPEAPTGKPIDAPTTWVAFSADFGKGDPGQAEEVVGRYFRASDGSDRVETGPQGDAARVVFIRNVAQARYYSRRMDKSGKVFWVSGPMSLPPDGWKPMQMTEAPGRRMMLTGRVEDRAVVQVSSTGSVSVLAPSLNFLAVMKRDVISGYLERYHNIQLGEPAADLFTPPAGEEIRRTTQVEGIKWNVRSTRPAAE